MSSPTAAVASGPCSGRKVPAKSPLTGKQVLPYYLHASDAYFRDVHGRAVLLRGVNLSGSSKAPLGQSTFDDPKEFWEKAEHGGESFVGQPLQLEDGSADVHLARLCAWGFNCFRYVFTWEALEHEGPGKYDHEFMDYTVEVLRKVKAYGFRVFMDPHQDLFSRFTGGSGAPYWVLPACGIDHRNITATQAAFLQCEWPSPEEPDPQNFPKMLWATNYTRLAAATLSVFFFAGRDLAPRCVLDGKNIQDWLQEHFINACRELALHIHNAGDLEDICVIGWDSINEPNACYIGLDAIDVLPDKWLLKKGPMPTPLQSMHLGVGHKQVVQDWAFGALGPKKQKDVEVDPKGKSLWLTHDEDIARGGSRWGWERDAAWPLGTCPWAAHGVWDIETGQPLLRDYFKYYRGGSDSKDWRPVDFVEDYWLPFWRAYAKMVRSVHKEAILFVQPPVFEPPPKSMGEADLQSRACTSQHFYDGLTLITKHWNWFNADAVGLLRGKYRSVLFAVKVGQRAIRQSMRDQLGYLRTDTLTVLGKYPTLIGEIGVPFDMDDRKTYYGDNKGNGIGDYSQQTTALDVSLNACDGTNMLSFTAWNYDASNSHKFGDQWNGEDFSFWSQDDVKYSPSAATRTSMPAVLDAVRAADSASDKVDDSLATVQSKSLSSPSASSSSSIPDVLQPSRPPLTRTDSSALRLDGVAKETDGVHIPAITNGSRAAQAFCRPYPIATTGTPYELNFDIKTSSLSFALDLAADDARMDAEGKDLATEIFIPFIHYAADSVTGAASGNVSGSGQNSPFCTSRSRVNTLTNANGHLAAGTRKAPTVLSKSLDSLSLGPMPSLDSSSSTPSISSSSSSPQRNGMALYSSAQSTTTSSSLSLNNITTSDSSKGKLASSQQQSVRGRRASAATAISDACYASSKDEFSMALEVQVSAGSWDIEPGTQVLRWYLRDAAPGRHSLHLKRAGGPIALSQSASAFKLLVESASCMGSLIL
ncbi:glycoside hydrolase family 5 protein [Tilletiaria anomala UBC 951]|uniref:Glycoside hydrolase family 5 protein n=1 Tax=Tilletiaria anomala (strain ATCC 24038 / CBS 436.72 / UBC 951) TaxID=1037660 RepID=A0A066VMN5_TILAU|nr:glycoside hydrolase family 5 protein [Tilletiaria anomala UBC 951]KDN42741.1 glycoside hydrolase family 5 protein [Tilletiaria anomala UBC 951]